MTHSCQLATALVAIFCLHVVESKVLKVLGGEGRLLLGGLEDAVTLGGAPQVALV